MMLHRRTVLGGAAATAAAWLGCVGDAQARRVRLAGGCNFDNTPLPDNVYPMKEPRDELLALFRRVLEAANASSISVEIFETNEPKVNAYVQYYDNPVARATASARFRCAGRLIPRSRSTTSIRCGFSRARTPIRMSFFSMRASTLVCRSMLGYTKSAARTAIAHLAGNRLLMMIDHACRRGPWDTRAFPTATLHARSLGVRASRETPERFRVLNRPIERLWGSRIDRAVSHASIQHVEATSRDAA